MEFVRLFAGSFYSPMAYRHMRLRQGNGLGYSAILVAVTTFLLTVYVLWLFHRAVFMAPEGKAPLFDDVLMQVADQVPVMSYSEGKLQTQEPHAYDILLQADIFGKHLQGKAATIDTTGATTYANMQAPVLVTAQEVIMRGRQDTKIKSLREISGDRKETLVINHALAVDMARMIGVGIRSHLVMIYGYVGVIIWLSFAFALYLSRLVTLLALGVAGLLLGRVLRNRVDFAASMRLAALSFTPVTVLDTLAMAVDGHTLSVSRTALCGVVMLVAALVVTREDAVVASA